MIESSCPVCGGLSSTLISPGLAQCSSTISWTEPQSQLVYETVEDPALFYNYGFRGTKQVAVTRTVVATRTQSCGHRYELEAPMSDIPCVCGPDGVCGAFSFGLCADCGRAVCRYHCQYFDGRLLCDACREPIESRRRTEAAEAARRAAHEAAEKQRLDEEQATAERERREQEKRVAKEAYDALPLYTEADWIDLLNSGVAQSDKRPGPLSPKDAARLITAAGKRAQQIGVESWKVRSGYRHRTGPGWVVDKATHQVVSYGERVMTDAWVILFEDGSLRFGHPTEIAGEPQMLHIYQTGRPSWLPSVETFQRAHPYLDRPPYLL